MKDIAPINKKCFTVYASGNSMLPTICAGSLLTVDTSEKEYKINDIVVYYLKEADGVKLVAHRIIYTYENRFVITKGDNNYRSDRPIRKNRIIGGN